MQGYCDVYKWAILKRTSPEVKCLHPTSSRREMCTSSVSNVIYHKFSHGAAFYTLNGKSVNVMLECGISHENVKLFYNYMLQHCNCIIGKGRCVCVEGAGLQFHIFFFLLFLREFSLKSCEFSLSCCFFSTALLNFEQCSL